MKRAGNLFSAICAYDNIRLAYYKAKRGKNYKKDVLLFRRNLDNKLNRIQQQLADNEIPLGNYHYFKIYDPKERTICAATFPERVVHHAIMNILDPVFEKTFIHDCYACRKNKGTDKALTRALYYTKKNSFFLKMDVRKYFDSINHDVLKDRLRRKIKDRSVLSLLDRIIDSYAIVPGKGLPIGNLTSQYFANYYLSFVDRFIKENLKIVSYVRYMDDMVLWGRDRDILEIAEKRIRDYLDGEFKLELKPSYCNNVEAGVPFLGYRISPAGIYLLQKKKRRFKKKFLEYQFRCRSGDWSQEKLTLHVQALLGSIALAKTHAYRYNLFHKVRPRAVTG